MFIIEVPYFNLDQIYNSKQAPRWIKLKEGKYVVINEDKAITVEQKRQRLILGCSEEEFYNTWFNYFDLKTDYDRINEDIKRINKKFKIPCNRGKGLHILNQDKFEIYVYCKLIQRVGWDKAKEMMTRIAVTYGVHHKNSMGDAGKVSWYEWPQPERLLECLERERISTPVKIFLHRLCRAIVYNDFDITKQDNVLFKLLGLHQLEQFPQYGLEETIHKNFSCNVEDFVTNFLNETEYKGMAYMYIHYHINNIPKERLSYHGNSK